MVRGVKLGTNGMVEVIQEGIVGTWRVNNKRKEGGKAVKQEEENGVDKESGQVTAKIGITGEDKEQGRMGREIRMGCIKFEGGVLRTDESIGWNGIRRVASALPSYGDILSFGKMQGFPTRRRPMKRELSDASEDVIEEWFWTTGITIGEAADSNDRQRRWMRVLYTWKECFARNLKEINATDLVEHAIELMPNAKPYKAKVPLWTKSERDYAKVLFPEMVAAGIVVMCDGPWGHRTRFIPKLHGSKELRTIHNFIPINKWTIPSAFPTPRVEQIVDTLVKSKFTCFSGVDATSSYWAIPLRSGDELKTGFVCPEGQFAYRRMGMGLKNGTHTYARFRQIVFGHIPKLVDEDTGEELVKEEYSLVGDHGTWAFDGMVDDSFVSAVDFEEEIRVWHEVIFPRIAFGPIYLKGSKCAFSMKTLDMTGLEGSVQGLRPSLEKRNKIGAWPTPLCREDVEAFAYLTPFLRRFIPGRAEHVRVMKLAYTTADGSEKEWEWGPDQNASFEWIKKSIMENACSGSDEGLQYHLSSDASKTGTGGVLFQLPGVPAGTTAGNKHKGSMRIVSFMSFRLTKTEGKYSTQEREGLAVMRNLDDCAWLIKGSAWPVKVYTDHCSLVSVMQKNTKDAHGRLARWQDRLTEYDYEIVHKAGVDHYMKLADGLSRLPSEYCSEFRGDLSDRLSMCLGVTKVGKTEVFVSDTDEELDSVVLSKEERERLGRVRKINLRVFEDVTKAGEDIGKGQTVGNVEEEVSSQAIGGDVQKASREEQGDKTMREKNWGTGAMWIPDKETGEEESKKKDNEAERERREREVGRTLESVSAGVKSFLMCVWYSDVVHYLIGGMEALLLLDDLGRNGRRAVVKKSLRYSIIGEELFWKERDGCLAKCVLKEEVEKVLEALHDSHGHFAGGLTIGRAIGQWYWPTREKDIWRHCFSCDTCQRVGPRKRSGELRPILQFRPFDMVGMDYVGPISPSCQKTGARYVLIVVDYFSRFVFARAFKEATQLTTLSMFFETIVPIFGWPMSIYCDNGSHFVGGDVQDTMRAFGVTLLTAPISHPGSVGLSERYVQMLVGALRRHCIATKTLENWGMQVSSAVTALNTRSVRVHGHTPSEILLGYNAKIAWPALRMRDGRVQTVAAEIGEKIMSNVSPEPEKWNIEELIATRDYRGDDMIMKRIAEQDRAIRSREDKLRWETPREGDLVMIRRHELDNQKGRKLESRWEGPKVLVRLSARGNSGFVKEVHGSKEKRYHVDDMKVYVSRRGTKLSTEGASGVGYDSGLAEEGKKWLGIGKTVELEEEEEEIL